MLNTIEYLISTALIDLDISNNQFLPVNHVLRAIENPKIFDSDSI